MADLQRFLEQVQNGISRDLSAEQVQSVLDETANHLRERILALSEIGLDHQSATAEALHHFGSPETYSFQIIQAHGPSSRLRDRRILGVATGASITAAAITEICLMLNLVPAMFLALLPLAAVAIVSYRSRRAIPLKLVPVAILALVAFTVLVGATHLGLASFGGTGILPPWQVESFRNFYEQSLGTELDTYARLQLSALSHAQDASWLTNTIGSIPQTLPFGGIWLTLLVVVNGLSAALGLERMVRRIKVIAR